VDSPTATKYAVAKVMKFTKPGNYFGQDSGSADEQVPDIAVISLHSGSLHLYPDQADARGFKVPKPIGKRLSYY
jgi:hypothetical protein